ncbi:MAG: helix-turn-helix domain-containing protein [Chitinivibrionales bacterium]|nr:helix-turn-helix domain-containing protein [Chitinivibrionales bacterium]
MMNACTAPFLVRTAGLVERLPYHSTPGTRQDDVMLTVFLAGGGSYRNSRGVTYVHADMAGLVPPEDIGVLMADPHDPYIHYYCRFNGAYAVELARRVIGERGARFFPVANAAEIADYLRQMGLYASRSLPDSMGKREALLAQALVALCDPQASETVPPITAATVEEYLREHIADPTDLERMADHFAVSRTTLCRRVKEKCGDTVQRIHEQLKMEWARTLLSMNRFPVAAVALRVGYQDPFYFSRVFRRNMGASPKRWARAAARQGEHSR